MRQQMETAVAEFDKTVDDSQESDKKPKFISQKGDAWKREVQRLSGYQAGANIGSRVVCAAIGGLLASKLGLSKRFDFENRHHLTDRMKLLIDKSLDKAPVASAVLENI